MKLLNFYLKLSKSCPNLFKKSLFLSINSHNFFVILEPLNYELWNVILMAVECTKRVLQLYHQATLLGKAKDLYIEVYQALCLMPMGLVHMALKEKRNH